MVHGWYVYRLVDYKDDCVAIGWIVVCECAGDGPKVSFGTQPGIVSGNVDWTIEILYDQGIATDDTRVGVCIKFSSRLASLSVVGCAEFADPEGHDVSLRGKSDRQTNSRLAPSGLLPRECRVLSIGEWFPLLRFALVFWRWRRLALL